MGDFANPTTMEGMIYNANNLLEQALKPGVNGLPKRLFKNCCGIVLTTNAQVGFIFSGSVGGGIALAKKPDGTWSPPCAVSMGGIGFGLLLGMSVRDFVIFVMDPETMAALSTKHGMALSAAVEVTVGPFGRTAQLNDHASKKGVGATVAIAYSKGAFAGFAAEGASIGIREFVNNKFYGAVTTPDQIFAGAYAVPELTMQRTMLQSVYDKLEKVSAGSTAEPDGMEEEKKKEALATAEKVNEEVKADPAAEVVPVDAAAEAAKEAK